MSDDLTENERAVLRKYREYKHAGARALFGGDNMSQENMDKFQAIAEMNHEAGHVEDLILDDLREAAEEAGWSIEQYLQDKA